tara:strand:+ start:1744 stop:1989 length:246 start_codon:yes stop_codon:yes gene_type:complete
MSEKDLPISFFVKRSLEKYFKDLNGEYPKNLYALSLSQLEKPLLEVVIKETKGNLSKAAIILGLNRVTLRKKLKKYKILER